MRPLKRDQARIRAIRDQLQTIDPKHRVLERVFPAIGELIRTEKPVAYTIAPGEPHLLMDQFVGRGFDVAGVKRGFQALLSSGTVRFTSYNPMRPEPDQRNIAFDAARRLGWDKMRTLPLYRRVTNQLGLGNHDQLRVLVCEGQTLLGYVGGWRHDHFFSDYERQLLQAITPDLRRALLLERQMRDSPRVASALDAALDAIPGEAYVLDQASRVTHANAAGRTRIDQDRGAVLEWLQAALKSKLPEVVLTRLLDGGTLAVRRGTGEREARVAAARVRYGLTVRQADVLLELARGKSNVEIAAALACSVATIETHFRALFEKLECESRAGLLAKLIE